jgi:hypothetical protein
LRLKLRAVVLAHRSIMQAYRAAENQIVCLFHNLSVFAAIQPKLLPLVIKVGEHLEAAGLHTVQRLHQSGLD